MATLGHDLTALADDELRQIRAQLKKILDSHHFSTSKRYGPLLKCVVEHALEGDVASLKERIIGSEVFGRARDYDTSTDPIVRVAIGEVRKRLAQYYVEKDHRGEVQIELLPGSYQPRFVFPPDARRPPDTLEGAHSVNIGEDPRPDFVEPNQTPNAVSGFKLGSPMVGVTSGGLKWKLFWIAGLVFAVGIGTALVLPRYRNQQSSSDETLNQFWQPLFAQHKRLSVVLAKSPNSIATEASFDPSNVLPVPVHLSPDSSLSLHLNQLTVNLDDVAALTTIARFAGNKIPTLRVFQDSATELADLKEGPVVLIGAVDNIWTLRAIQQLPFHVEKDRAAKERYYITNPQKQGDKSWGVDFDAPVSKETRDYVLIARLRSRDTGQETVVVSGLGGNGTIAAAEFLTNPDLMQQARPKMSASTWANGDFEIVLQTDAIGDTPTPPEIIATTTF